MKGCFCTSSGRGAVFIVREHAPALIIHKFVYQIRVQGVDYFVEMCFYLVIGL